MGRLINENHRQRLSAMPGHGSHWRAQPVALACLLAVLFAWVYTTFLQTSTPAALASPPGLTHSALQQGLARCVENSIHPTIDHELPRRRLYSLPENGPTTVYDNVTLINGDGHITPDTTIITQSGIVKLVCSLNDGTCPSLDKPHQTIYNLGGRIVTPGLVDMHSHAGVRQVPELLASEDVTELNHGSVSPWARAIDGLKPADMGIQLLVSGGVTTSLVLTGAKNIISGEGLIIKMKKTNTLQDLLIDQSNHQDGINKPQRYLKMACGENIKTSMGGSLQGPNTRQGQAYDARLAYSRAQTLKRRQDDWCEVAQSYARGHQLQDRYPEDLALQTLVDVLRGDIRTNVHCYEPEDVHSMFSIADEFQFNITSLHHALEAHHVLDLLTSHGTMLATFSDEWGFKKETMGASAYMLKTAAEAGIPIALTSDHPAKNGQFIAYEAQIANHFGLSPELTMASLTSIPAAALGINNRVGDLRPGFDADIVIWDKHPLKLGARPLQVVLEGNVVVNASDHLWTLAAAHDGEDTMVPPPARYDAPQEMQCDVNATSFIVEGLTRDFVTKRGGLVEGNLTLVVDQGHISCIDTREACGQAVKESTENGASIYKIDNGQILPGLTMITRAHGLADILSEPSTSDGIHNGENTESPPRAVFGLSFGGQHLQRAHMAGITSLLVPPRSSGFVHGTSVMFASGAQSRLDGGAVVKSDVALHFTIGDAAKGYKFPTIGSQIQELRWLIENGHNQKAIYTDVSSGRLPLVIHTGNKDVISELIGLKREQPQLDLVIMGGAEAHLVANEIAAANISVILAPWMCHPWSWDVRQCPPGPPLTEQTSASALIQAGVQMALGNWDTRDRYVRNALWEASWIVGPGHPEKAVAMVSSTMEDILGLPQTQSFVIYNKDPLEFGASVALMFENGAISSCWPDVE